MAAVVIHGDGVGVRIRRLRRAQGLSLDQAAGLAGISKPYLSRLERGERALDSRELLTRIAEALEVSVADLTGQPHVPRDTQHTAARRGIPAIRLALLDPSGPALPEAQVADAVDSLASVMAACDLASQGRLLPDLLVSAEVHAQGVDSPIWHRRVAVVAYASVFFLRNLGELDLAVMAGELMSRHAQESGDPATIGLAAYGRAHSLLPAGAARRARQLAVQAADETPGTDPEAVAARGSCLLVAASSSAVLGDFDNAREQLAAADELATRVEVPTAVAGHTSFSDWNAVMYRVNVEVEAGDPAAALRAADRLRGEGIAQRERMSYFWVDVGRAHAQLDRHRDAITAFRRAERAAPLRVHLSPEVRDSVRDLLEHAYRRSAGAELRGLAERCGVLAAE